MSRIVFRGKTYNSVFEMPNDIREAYQREKRNQSPGNNASTSLADFVEMSDEIREMYERAVGNVSDKSTSSGQLSNLPNTDEIYRQSAPSDMRHLPSDESIYRESKPLTPDSPPAIEEDNGPIRLAITIAVIIALGGIVLFLMQTV